MIYDLSSETAVLYTGLHKPGRATLRLGCELTLRNCLTILSCSYAKICDFIVAQEMPDSLTTMFKISSNVLILAIVANKMAFSLTTTQL